MKNSWLLTTVLELLRAVAILCVGYACFMIGAVSGLLLASKPTQVVCGLNSLPMFIAGGLGGVLAFRQGIYKSQFLHSVTFAIVSLWMIVGPVAVFSATVRGDFETSLRLVGSAICIGAVNGAIGGVLGAFLFRGQRALKHRHDSSIRVRPYSPRAR